MTILLYTPVGSYVEILDIVRINKEPDRTYLVHADRCVQIIPTDAYAAMRVLAEEE